MAVHDPRIVERWRKIVADWRNSRLGVAAFCRSRHVNTSGFHRWRNILDQLDHGRKSNPAKLPHRREEIDVSDTEKVCPCCAGIHFRSYQSTTSSRSAALQ
jgi:hypothetical protein